LRATNAFLIALIFAASAARAGQLPTRLYVRTIPPGARVVVDGKELGLADGVSSGLFVILPGDHTVTIELEGYAPEKRDIKATEEHITRVVISLVKREVVRDDDGKRQGAPAAQPPEAVPPRREHPALPPYTEKRLADMPMALHDFACSDVLDGKAYLFGGDRGNDRLVETILIYDTTKDSWHTAKGKLPYAYAASGGSNLTTVWGRKIYISPGVGPRRNNDWGQHERVIEFDPADESAREAASFGAVVWCVSPVTCRNVIYWIGACGIGQEKKIWRHDPDRNSIRHIADLAGPARSTSALLATDAHIYAFGGQDRRAIDVLDVFKHTCVVSSTQLPEPMGTPHVWPGPGDIVYLTSPLHNPGLCAFDTRKGKFAALDYMPSFAKETGLPGHSYDPDTGSVFFFGGRQGGIWERPVTRAHVLIPTRAPRGNSSGGGG